MIKAELQKIFHNKILTLSIIAISIIPLLYTATFLKSIWDPYGSMNNLPVAVVNNDQPVSFHGTRLHVGQDITDTLRKDDSLGWHIVSEDEANKGLENHEYYMVVTFPKDFSERATTVTQKHPQKMDIAYTTNGSLNYLGEVVSNTAVQQLQHRVAEKISEQYVETMFDALKTVGKGMETASNGSQQLNNGIKQLGNGINTLHASTPALVSGINQLASGSMQLDDGIHQYTQGVGKLTVGSDQLLTGMTTYSNGVNQMALKVRDTIANTQREQMGKLVQLSQAIHQLAQGATQLEQAVNSQGGLTPEQREQMALLNKYADAAQEYFTTVQQQLEHASNTQSKDAIEQMFNTVKSDLTGIQAALANVQHNLPTAVQHDVANNIAAMVQQGIITPEQAPAVQAILVSTARSGETAQLIQQQLTDAGSHLQNVGSALQNNSIGDIMNKMDTMMQQLAQSTNQLAQGSTVATPGIHQLTSQIQAINKTTEEQLKPAIGQLTQGLQQVDSATSQFSSPAFAQQLQGTIAQIENKINTLVDGTNQLQHGVENLDNGAHQLNNESAKLTNGAGQLSAGLQTLHNNTPALQHGIEALQHGANALGQGSQELATKLAQGAEEIKSTPVSHATAQMMANPVAVQHKNYSYVPNYGHALAPYFMSVSLFVGAMLFNFIYPIRKRAKNGTWLQWFMSKIAVAGGVALAMAVIIGAAMMAIGLQVDNPAQFFGMLGVFSLTNMFLIMFLAMAFDNPGRFVAMLLLVLQLGGAGGTFPMEVTPKFFNIVHPILPMSYSILGLRQAISGGIGLATFMNALLIVAGFGIIAIILLAITMYILDKKGKVNQSQLNNNQQLMSDDYNNTTVNTEYPLWS